MDSENERRDSEMGPIRRIRTIPRLQTAIGLCFLGIATVMLLGISPPDAVLSKSLGLVATLLLALGTLVTGATTGRSV